MKLRGRNLSIKMQGEEVKLLHSKPKMLHLFIAVNELNTVFWRNHAIALHQVWKAIENHVESLDGRESSTKPIRIQGELID